MIEIRYSRDVLTVGRGLTCRENKLGVWVWCAAASFIDLKANVNPLEKHWQPFNGTFVHAWSSEVQDMPFMAVFGLIFLIQ
jgi:hypothetical protein